MRETCQAWNFREPQCPTISYCLRSVKKPHFIPFGIASAPAPSSFQRAANTSVVDCFYEHGSPSTDKRRPHCYPQLNPILYLLQESQYSYTLSFTRYFTIFVSQALDMSSPPLGPHIRITSNGQPDSRLYSISKICPFRKACLQLHPYGLHSQLAAFHEVLSQRRQPLGNLALLVRLSHVITAPQIPDIIVNSSNRTLICYRTHLVPPTDIRAFCGPVVCGLKVGLAIGSCRGWGRIGLRLYRRPAAWCADHCGSTQPSGLGELCGWM